MANAAGLINESLWRKDKDFQRLPRLAQCTFCQILSQKDLDTCGVLTLNLELLAKACDELTVDQLRADFDVLEPARFVFVDYDTDELLVRSYVRLVSAKKGPKGTSLAWKSVPKSARLLGSVKLRHELAKELRRVRWREADELADEIDPNPSEPPSKPLGSPSENGSPLEGGSKPHRSVQVPVLVSPNVVGSFREPPTEFCKAHPNGTDKNCFACGQARRDYPERKAQYDENVKAAAALQRQAAIDDCELCDEFGDITFDDSVRRCDHQGQAHA